MRGGSDDVGGINEVEALARGDLGGRLGLHRPGIPGRLVDPVALQAASVEDLVSQRVVDVHVRHGEAHELVLVEHCQALPAVMEHPQLDVFADQHVELRGDPVPAESIDADLLHLAG